MDPARQKYLEIRDPRGRIRRFLLKGDPVVVGRAEDATLFLDSVDVSRRHCLMELDGLGRWMIRDLGSRNGTIVNGDPVEASEEDINWQTLEPGDQIEVGDYLLTLMVSSQAMDWAMGHGVSYVNVEATPRSTGGLHGKRKVAPGLNIADVPDVRVSEDDDGKGGGGLQTLENAGEVRIDAEALLAVGGFAGQLLQTEKAINRVAALCSLMLHPAMHGQAVTVVRVSKTNIAAQPQPLIKTRYHSLCKIKLYLSRTVLRNVAAFGQPILGGTGQSMEQGAVEMSIVTRQVLSVIAAPLLANAEMVDVLYVGMDPNYATKDYLALVGLAAKQFETAENSWYYRRHAVAQAQAAEAARAGAQPQMRQPGG